MLRPPTAEIAEKSILKGPYLRDLGVLCGEFCLRL